MNNRGKERWSSFGPGCVVWLIPLSAFLFGIRECVRGANLPPTQLAPTTATPEIAVETPSGTVYTSTPIPHGQLFPFSNQLCLDSCVVVTNQDFNKDGVINTQDIRRICFPAR